MESDRKTDVPEEQKQDGKPENQRTFSLIEKFKKAETRDIVRWCLTIIFLDIAVCALVILISGIRSDRKAQQTYADLAEMMSGMEGTPQSSAEQASVISAEENDAAQETVPAIASEPQPAAAETQPAVSADAQNDADDTDALMSSAAEAAAAEAAETYRQESAEREILPQFEALVAKNSDICGWVYIPGADISYPVVWTPDDPEYYLRRDIYKDYSRSGTPFVGKGCTVDSDCLLIYGHNMVNGTMFSNLTYYAKKSFWQKNPTFNFNTIYEYREYQVFAAVDCRLSENEAEGFQYYQYSGDMTKEQFNRLKEWLQSHSAYDTGIEPEYGDQILILSTCGKDYSDERFLIAAFRTPDA